MGMVGIKLEIGNAAPGLCDDGLVSRPDASDSLKGAAQHQHALSLGPQPQPFGVPEWGTFYFAFKEGPPESVSSATPECVITERHDNGWPCKLIKQIVSPPSKSFLIRLKVNPR